MCGKVKESESKQRLRKAGEEDFLACPPRLSVYLLHICVWGGGCQYRRERARKASVLVYLSALKLQGGGCMQTCMSFCTVHACMGLVLDADKGERLERWKESEKALFMLPPP